MAVLRFPNPVSDVPKFVDVFRILHTHLKTPNFGHDDIVKVMIDNGQVSSCGTVGEAALSRSTRDDRSRDPLFNQVKMYSELFRMLGWLHPGSDSGHFVFSGLAQYIATERMDSPLIRESLYSIVVPNPHVENRGGHILRPFAQLLRMMRRLDGIMSRDEIIVAMLCLMDDRKPGAVDAMVELIKKTRGKLSRLAGELENAAGSLQENTLKNYTRFPLGVLKSAGWAEPERVRGVYERSLNMYRLTPQGAALADAINAKVDVRQADIAKFADEERAAFVLLAQYAQFGRGKFDLTEITKHIPTLESKCDRILKAINSRDFNAILYAPFQQAPAIDLMNASKLDEALTA